MEFMTSATDSNTLLKAPPIASITPDIPSVIVRNPSLIDSTTSLMTSPAVFTTFTSVFPTVATIVPTASATVETKSPNADNIIEIENAIDVATCETVSPNCLTNGIKALMREDARFIPAPTISIVAPNESIAGIAAVKAVPKIANTATKAATTTPNAAIAIAPSVPVLAIGAIAKAIAATDTANTPIPIALSCNFFPNTPNIAVNPPITIPNAASAGTAVSPNFPSGTSANATPASAANTRATAPAIFTNDLEAAFIFWGDVLIFFKKLIKPKLKANTAPAIPARICYRLCPFCKEKESTTD